MNEFTNQVILITGAGSGLGRQLALDLAQEGAAIAALDLRPEPLESLAKELSGKRIAWAVADVTDRAALGKGVAQVQEQLGAVDVLIANAGIGQETSAFYFRAADVETQIKVNLIGVANSIEAVLPGMIERRRGHLVGMSSLASYHGLPFMAGYCASKAGVNALLDALRVELRPVGIQVTTICPGWVRTPLTANIHVPLYNVLEVAEATRLIVAAIRRKRQFYAFPRATLRRVRLLSWLPTSWGDWLVRKLAGAALRENRPPPPARG
jgi:NAD(P)-dependent dehydrogenase (short-subunit alcohol dehydrogenase family)